METTMLDAALSQGIWAVVAVFLLIYVVKSNEQRDKKQEERENNYQSVIEKLTEKYQILYTVQNDLNEIKNHLLAIGHGLFGMIRQLLFLLEDF